MSNIQKIKNRIRDCVAAETLARLDDLSSQTNRSRNELINIFLNYAMDRCIVEEDTKK